MAWPMNRWSTASNDELAAHVVLPIPLSSTRIAPHELFPHIPDSGRYDERNVCTQQICRAEWGSALTEIHIHWFITVIVGESNSFPPILAGRRACLSINWILRGIRLQWQSKPH
jgi:hypothetical protein